MTGKVLQLDDIIVKDQMATQIAKTWQEWNMFRDEWMQEKTEIRSYIFAVDTTKTTNNKLEWKNKTTIPKLCQIRDNLWANYTRTLFPKRKWIKWEAYDEVSDDYEKREAIEAYICWAIERSDFKNTVSKLVLDWIDYGNCFATVEWKDDRQQLDSHDQVGYVGPVVKRISPIDIVFNPIASSFTDSPKIIRSLVSLGDVKEFLERISTDDTREQKQDLFSYLLEVRRRASDFQGDIQAKDEYFNVDGFQTYRAYLESDYCELLTFYGDLYDREGNKFYRNHIITVVDRHKILDLKPSPSYFGRPPIWHVGWRTRQDNLWAMGPLDNLVGMQYRIDHLENLKADVFDLVAFPPLKITGLVDDFEWGPFAQIHVGDDGNVELLNPDINALNANLEIDLLQQKMEEMAGSPKEAMGFRTPGEKTAYEVQRLENASGRIYQSKTEMFEEQMVEQLLSGMLELARRNLSQEEIGVFDDEFKITTFMTLSSADITGNGRIKPIAARHFAEKAERVQNVTEFFNSGVGQDPAVNVHFSGVKLATMFEDLLDIEGYGVVQPFVRIAEQADAERQVNSQMEQVQMEAGAPSGLTPEDVSGNIGSPPIPLSTPEQQSY